jgi:hypothetical protein
MFGARGIQKARVADLRGVLRELDVDPRNDVHERAIAFVVPIAGRRR